MNTITYLLSVDSTFFTIIGYNMSYIEFFGTILNIWAVYLVAKNKKLNWVVGIFASLLFMFLFWQIQLYSDFFEQIYFVITGFIGWLYWTKGEKTGSTFNGKISLLTNLERVKFAFVSVIGTALLSVLTMNLNKLLPTIFVEPVSYPVFDAFTTVLSFVATYFLIIKKIESWVLWIFVDVIAIWLYFVKDVKFVSLLYCIFLVLAISGLISWIKTYRNYAKI